MSYLHCPTCKRAYNIATSTACPTCPVPATVVDPSEDIVAAAEALARAMARATPDERDAAMSRMDHLALPAPGARPATFHGATLRAIREALEPSAPPPVPRPQPLLVSIAVAVAERAWPRIDRTMPRLGEGLRRARSRVRELRALAA